MSIDKEKLIKKYDKACEKAIKKGELDFKKDYCVCAALPAPIDVKLDAVGTCFKCKAKIVFRRYNKDFKRKVCAKCMMVILNTQEKKDTSYIG